MGLLGAEPLPESCITISSGICSPYLIRAVYSRDKPYSRGSICPSSSSWLLSIAASNTRFCKPASATCSAGPQHPYGSLRRWMLPSLLAASGPLAGLTAAGTQLIFHPVWPASGSRNGVCSRADHLALFFWLLEKNEEVRFPSGLMRNLLRMKENLLYSECTLNFSAKPCPRKRNTSLKVR